jgi:ubiquitin fusion degradation protein 1
MMPGKERENVNFGGKIVLPPSALNKLTMLHITYPMLFELQSEETELKTHAGVLEFIAEEGRVYLPQWMMETLAVQPGSLIQVGSIDLPLGLFVKIEPQSTDFLEISDPKAVLENALRNFSTLTVDDIFQISYNNRIYSIKVLEAKPASDSNSICVVETDLEVDFAPPVGYVEPERTAPSSVGSPAVPSRGFGTPVGTMAQRIDYTRLAGQTQGGKETKDPFSGSGQRLSGKSKAGDDKERSGTPGSSILASDGDSARQPLDELPASNAAALNLPFGQLFFGYPIIPVKRMEDEKERESEEAINPVEFKGFGQSLRQSRKRKDHGENARPTKARNQSPEVIEID